MEGIDQLTTKPKYLLSNLEVLLDVRAQCLNRTTELDPQNLSSLGGNRVMAFTLQKIHSIEPKRLDLHQRLGLARLRLLNIRRYEKGISIARPTLDI